MRSRQQNNLFSLRETTSHTGVLVCGTDYKESKRSTIMNEHEKLPRTGRSRKSRDVHETYYSLDGDGDVWVERVFKIPGAETKSYFRSVRTNECVWSEAPTMASHIVFLSEIDQYPFLKEFATGPLGKPLWTIEPSRKTPELQKKRGLFALVP